MLRNCAWALDGASRSRSSACVLMDCGALFVDRVSRLVSKRVALLVFEKEVLFVSVLGTSISRKARQAFPAEPNPATFVICEALPVGRKKKYSQKWNERACRR